MTKLRRNHTKQSAAASGGMVTKVGIFAAIFGVLFFLFNRGGTTTEDSPYVDPSEELTKTGDGADFNLAAGSENFWPTSTTGEIVERLHYTLSYSEEHEQAEWVAYKLTKESIQVPNVDRTGDFRPDPKIRKASASPRDYYGSGYDRGHLVPAGDMAFSREAMSETFYMSNMSPQIRNFNGGIWRELEENVRDWAYTYRELYVVTGPVLTQGIRERIGGNRVSVPDYYFKVLLDIAEPEKKGIAFLIPNEVSTRPLDEYAVSINEVEALTGIDFFHQFMNDAFEEELESMSDVGHWKMDKNKERQRLEQWNKRN
jgi:endonuclease G